MKLNSTVRIAVIYFIVLNADIAFAADSPNRLANTNTFNTSNNQAAISHLRPDGMTWSNANADDFRAFLGDIFAIKTDDNRSINLKLTDVIAGATDRSRPNYLPRKQSVIAVLEASESDEDWLAASGSQVTDCWHHELGNGRILINVIKERKGGHSIEFILN